MRTADVDAFAMPREEWLKKELKKKHNEEYRSGYLEGVRVTLFELQDERLAPTVDAEPVVHGHWVDNGIVWSCSACGKMPTYGMGYVQARNELYAYCPHCGAKMDEVSE